MVNTRPWSLSLSTRPLFAPSLLGRLPSPAYGCFVDEGSSVQCEVFLYPDRTTKFNGLRYSDSCDGLSLRPR